MPDISADLLLELDQAFGSIDEVGSRLTEAGERAADAIAQALSDSAQSFDAAPVAVSITAAGAEGGAGVQEALGSALDTFDAAPIEAGLVEAGAAGGDAVAGSLAESIEGFDASPIAAEIAGIDATVPVEADVASVGPAITEAVEGAIQEADTSVVFEDADASAVTEAIEGAIQDADVSGLAQIGSQASEGAGGLSDLASSGVQYATAAKLASGASGLLSGQIGGVISKALPAGAAIVGLGTGIGFAFNAAADAAEVQARLNILLGEAAPLIENIDVGGLRTDISALAIDLGSSDEAFRTAIANWAQFAQSGGVAEDQIVDTSKVLVALGANAAALNPTLGDAGEATDRMTAAFIRGGRALRPFGIDLTAVQIANEAVRLGLAGTVEEVTATDRVIAGAQLTLAKYGDSIGANVEEASKRAATQARSLRESFGELVEALGKPFTEPVGSGLSDLGEGLQTVTGFVEKLDFSLESNTFLNPIGALQDWVFGTEEAAESTKGFTLTVEESAVEAETYVGALDDVAFASQEAADAHDAMITSIAEGFPDASDALSRFSKDAEISFKEFQKDLTDTAAANETFVKNLDEIISKGGLQIAASLAELGPEVAGRAAAEIAKQTPKTIAALEEQEGVIRRRLVELAIESSRIQAEAKAAAILIDGGIPKEAALTVVEETHGTILARIAEMTPEEAAEYINGLSSGITGGTGTVSGSAVGVMESASAAAATAGHHGGGRVGAASIGGMTGAIIGGTGAVAGAGRTAAGGLNSAAGTAYGAGVNVGHNFVAGIYGVISSRATLGGIYGAAFAAGRQMGAGANAGARSSSPSKDGMQVAQNFIDGIQIQLRKGAREVAIEAAALGASIGDAATARVADFPAFRLPDLIAKEPSASALAARSGSSFVVAEGALQITIQAAPGTDEAAVRRGIDEAVPKIYDVLNALYTKAQSRPGG